MLEESSEEFSLDFEKPSLTHRLLNQSCAAFQNQNCVVRRLHALTNIASIPLGIIEGVVRGVLSIIAFLFMMISSPIALFEKNTRSFFHRLGNINFQNSI